MFYNITIIYVHTYVNVCVHIRVYVCIYFYTYLYDLYILTKFGSNVVLKIKKFIRMVEFI